MRHIFWSVLAATAVLLVASRLQAADVDDASGIFVNRGEFVIVGNKDDGKYFRFALGLLPNAGKVSRLDSRGRSVHVNQHADDIEDIDLLAGRYVVLSEQHAAVYDSNGTIFAYSSKSKKWPVSEDSKGRGLEGLAVWPHPGGLMSDVAISWEGGKGRDPRIYWHTVRHSELKKRLSFRVDRGEVHRIKLKTKELRRLTGVGGSFRVPAVVFAQDGSAIIALLSTGKHKWLMRFNRRGAPVGGIRTLTSLGMDNDEIKRNWEGLAWIRKTKLALVSDNRNSKRSTRVFVADLPLGW